jgi:hypothetical protein
MPEVPLCPRCKKPIDVEKENYVVLNKDTAKYENQWILAHADCVKKG